MVVASNVSFFLNSHTVCDCLVGLLVANATSKQKVLGSIPESEVLLGFSIRNFSESWSLGFRSVDGNWLVLLHGTKKNTTSEIWVYYSIFLTLRGSQA